MSPWLSSLGLSVGVGIGLNFGCGAFRVPGINNGIAYINLVPIAAAAALQNPGDGVAAGGDVGIEPGGLSGVYLNGAFGIKPLFSDVSVCFPLGSISYRVLIRINIRIKVPPEVDTTVVLPISVELGFHYRIV